MTKAAEKAQVKRNPNSHNGRGKFVVARSIWHDPALSQTEPMSQREAYLWMIGNASWEPRVISGPKGSIHLSIGELSHSIPYLEEAFGWTSKKVRNFLDKIGQAEGRSEGQAEGQAEGQLLSYRMESGQRVIRVCNYEEIQSFVEAGSVVDFAERAGKRAGQGAGQGAGKGAPKRTPFKTPSETPLKQDNPSPRAQGSGSSVSPEYSEGFEEWYATFPNRKGKGEANKAYIRALKKTTHEELMTATANMVRWRENQFKAQQQNPRHFVPECKHPATWLNQECWHDELKFTHASQRRNWGGV